MAFFLPRTIRKSDRRLFANKVCEGLWKTGENTAIVSVQNDGSDTDIMSLPGAARYIAVRNTTSWTVIFDWRDGKTHRVTIQLPDEWAL